MIIRALRRFGVSHFGCRCARRLVWQGFRPAADAEQIAAIRQSCRSDFMSHCAGVQPGGREALQCLKRNAASVSAPCKSALDAVGPKPAPQPLSPSLVLLRQPTRQSPPLRHRHRAPAEPAQAAATPPAVRHRTRADRSRQARPAASRCSPAAVPLRFRRALPRRKTRRLRRVALPASQCCRAVAGVPECRASGGGEGGAPPAAARRRRPQPQCRPQERRRRPRCAPLGPIPPMMPRQAIADPLDLRRRAMGLCGNITAGGGRIIACLAENAPRLSPACYNAIARAIR